MKRTEALSAVAATAREHAAGTEADASCAGGVATSVSKSAPGIDVSYPGPVRFEAAQSVAKAGVLVALPALLSQGLLGAEHLRQAEQRLLRPHHHAGPLA